MRQYHRRYGVESAAKQMGHHLLDGLPLTYQGLIGPQCRSQSSAQSLAPCSKLSPLRPEFKMTRFQLSSSTPKSQSTLVESIPTLRQSLFME